MQYEWETRLDAIWLMNNECLFVLLVVNLSLFGMKIIIIIKDEGGWAKYKKSVNIEKQLNLTGLQRSYSKHVCIY